MLDVVGADGLVVIANTGDDIEIYGAYVSPDPDLVTFWLADAIDERGWGLDGDTFAVMDGLRELGVEVWFNLGDRDLAIGLERARALDGGARLTEAQARIAPALGVRAPVLPMSDRPVRTRVLADGRWWPLQEFMIKRRGEGPVEDVDFRNARAAAADPGGPRRAADARAIVIGPSNPVISIGPILALPGVAQAIARQRGAGRRRQPARSRPGAQGPDRGVHAVGRAHRAQRRDRRDLRRTDRRPRRRRAHRGAAGAGDRRDDGHADQRAAACRADAPASPLALTSN